MSDDAERAEVDLHRGFEVYDAAKFVGDEQAADEAAEAIAAARRRLGAARTQISPQ